MRQEKRHKLQLFYEILIAIEDDMSNNDAKLQDQLIFSIIADYPMTK